MTQPTTDPHPQRPFDTEIACPLPEAGFSAAEHWVWSRVICGRPANLKDFIGDNPEDKDIVDEKVRLSDRFLRTILFHSPWAEAIERPSVRILNAHVEDYIDWSFQHLAIELWIDQSRFCADLNIRGLHVDGLLSFEGTELQGNLLGIGLVIGDDLLLSSGFRCQGNMRLHAARISGDLDLHESDIGGELILDRCRIGGMLIASRDTHCTGALSIVSAVIEGDVNLAGLKADTDVSLARTTIGGNIAFDSATIGGKLEMSKASVSGGFTSEPGFHCAGYLDLSGASFGALVYFQGGKVDGLVNLISLTCQQGLALGASVYGSEENYRMEIGGDLHAGGTVMHDLAMFHVHVAGGTYAPGLNAVCDLNIDRSHFVGEVKMLDVRIANTFTLEGVVFEGEWIAEGLHCNSLFLRRVKRAGTIKLMAAELTGDLQLRESRLEGVIDLTSARIAGELHLQKASDEPAPDWGEHAALILRNASCGALAGGIEAFRNEGGKFIRLDLAGFSCGRLGGFGSADMPTLAAASPGRLVQLLKSRVSDGNWFQAQPYEAIARALENSGERAKANRLRMAARNHEMVSRGPSLSRKLGLFFSGIFIGHGYRSGYALAWFVAATLGSALFGLWATGASLSGPPDADALFGWIRYTVWNGIPLIDGGIADDFLAGAVTAAGDNLRVSRSLIQLVFDAEKLFGFVILTYLAAGLSGLAAPSRE